LPNEVDFVLAFSTLPGYASWRNSEKGSWFIEAFVQKMRELSKTNHFTEILTEVNRVVAEGRESNTSKAETTKKKQATPFMSALTRQLHF
jgi:hypothetical protein